jgi:tetratricopeptide (TPR) repeat protein
VGYTQEPQGGGAVLLILDNVDRAELLSQRQLSLLPKLDEARDRIRILATSRKGKDELPAQDVCVLELGRLTPDEAKALMAKMRRGCAYPDAAYEAGINDLVGLLDGYTLAVEQVAAYLALNDDVNPGALAQHFRKEGLAETDALLIHDERVKGELMHPAALMRIVLAQTLKSLDSVPLARRALELAAFMPPDHVPWEWLRSLVQKEYPAYFEGSSAHLPNAWEKARKRLASSQLLVESSSGVAWLHRVIGDHLRKRLTEIAPDLSIKSAEAIDEFALTVVARHAHRTHKWDARFEGDQAALHAYAFNCKATHRRNVTSARISKAISDIEAASGRLSVAGELAEYALEAADALSREDPRNLELLQLRASAYRNLANCLLKRSTQGDLDLALSHLRQAEDIFSYLRDKSTNIQPLLELIFTREGIAALLIRRGGRGDIEGGIALYKQELEKLNYLTLVHSDHDELKLNWAILADQYVDALVLFGKDHDMNVAREIQHKRLHQAEQLKTAYPNDERHQRELAFAYHKLASIHDRMAYPNAAVDSLPLLERSLKLRKEMWDRDKTNAVILRDLSVGRDSLAGHYLRRNAQGDAEKAIALLTPSLEAFESLVAGNPLDGGAVRDLAEVCAYLSQANERLGGIDVAITHQRRAVELNFQMHQRENSVHYSEHFAISVIHLASLLLRLETEDARAEYALLMPIGHKIFSELNSMGALRAQWQPTLAEMDDFVARATSSDSAT